MDWWRICILKKSLVNNPVDFEYKDIKPVRLQKISTNATSNKQYAIYELFSEGIIDNKNVIEIGKKGQWDGEMIAYPYVIKYKNQKFMFYNGNAYGKEGVGLAIQS